MWRGTSSMVSLDKDSGGVGRGISGKVLSGQVKNWRQVEFHGLQGKKLDC